MFQMFLTIKTPNTPFTTVTSFLQLVPAQNSKPVLPASVQHVLQQLTGSVFV